MLLYLSIGNHSQLDVFIWTFFLTMTDTVTSQNIDLSCWIVLYMICKISYVMALLICIVVFYAMFGQYLNKSGSLVWKVIICKVAEKPKALYLNGYLDDSGCEHELHFKVQNREISSHNSFYETERLVHHENKNVIAVFNIIFWVGRKTALYVLMRIILKN